MIRYWKRKATSVMAVLFAVGMAGGCNGMALPDLDLGDLTPPIGASVEVEVEGKAYAQAFVKKLDGEKRPLTDRYYVQGVFKATGQWPELPHLIIDVAWDTNVLLPPSVGDGEIRSGMVEIRRHGGPAEAMVPYRGREIAPASVPYIPTAPSSSGCGCEVAPTVEYNPCDPLPASAPPASSDCAPVYTSPCGVRPPTLHSSNPHNTLCKGLPVPPAAAECRKTFDSLVGK